MVKKLPFILFFILWAGISLGQENCNNGIDDDGDGFIDCYDSECTGSTACSGFFYGQSSVICSMTPVNPAFNLNTIWQSTVDVSTRSTMMVGDMDADGSPEVVCHQSGVNELYILDGVTGALEVTINCPSIADHVDAIAIGDTDDDGFGEIYVVTSDNVLRCFEHDGTPKAGYTPPTTGGTNESIPGIADFDQDGIPELYKDNRIYNSLTGALIASGTGSTGNNPGSNGSPAGMPVAADVLPTSYCASCDGLELICGNRVYAVDIAGATITPIAHSLPGSLGDGFTSIADIDVDGLLDVVVVSSGKIYVWDPRTGLQIGNTFTIPNTGAGGRANIGDYDNDGLPEIGAGGRDRYVVVDIDTATNMLSQKWIKTIVDGSEHTTGSVFDFDCDGKAQVVYRDENNLYVWDGETGNVIASVPCGSATRSEFPTIVDVDGDGQVNIVCACATNNGGGAGKVKVFNSSTNQWVASRKVMNQHSYCVTNINDDLSIPIQQQNHALLPKINGFLAQSAVYDMNWNSTCIPLADINVTIDSIIYCQKPDSIVLEITVCNIGSKVTTPPINISTYNGNPLSGGTLITTTLVANQIQVDSCLPISLSIPYTADGTWYVFVNDNGTNPADAPQSVFIECDSSNNGAFVAIVKPVITVAITGDTVLCNGESTSLTASGADTYSWTPATGLSSTSTATVTATPLSTTTYTITGTDTVNGCNNFSTATLVVNPNPIAIFGSTEVCKGASSQFTDTSTTSSGTITTWVWSFGDGDSLTGAQHPTHLYSNAGTFLAHLLAGNSLGCFDTISKNVEVYANATPGFTHADVCFTDTMYFTNTSTVPPPATITSYSWNFGDGSAAANTANTSHFYAAEGNFNVKLVTTTSNGCSDSITVPVTVFDPPVAAFTFANTCQSDAAIFTNASTNPSIGTIAGWQWDFGDGSPVNTSTSSPNHQYTAAGSYEVTLITNSSNMGCADTLKDSITVFPVPVADFAVEDVCLNQVSEFYDSSTVSSASITSWQWDMGDASSSSLENPTYTYLGASSFACTLIVTSSDGCKDTVSKNTIVHPLPLVQFTNNSVCEGVSTEFTNTSVIPPNPSNDIMQFWFWNFGDSSPLSVQQNPSHTYASSSSYPVKLIVVTDFGCADSVTNTITVNPLPVVVFSSPDTSDCQPLCTSFQSASFVNNGTIASWLWDFGDNITSSSQDAPHCYINITSSAISFSPTLTVTSNNGCVSSLTKTNYIEVFPQPVAQFTVNPQIVNITEPIVNISNSSTLATIWNWDFGDSQTSTQENPYSHLYADTGSYTIVLITSNQYTCADTTQQTAIVEPDFLFYIPNAFTPDEDGVNDTFSGKGVFIKKYEMFIFDRWGNQIYHTDSMESPWDGRIDNGKEAAMQDVYVYSINITDFKDLKHNYKGIVTLIR